MEATTREKKSLIKSLYNKRGVAIGSVDKIEFEVMEDYANSQLSDLVKERDRLKDILEEAKLQIEYLHGKFKETGSGNSVLSRIDQTLQSLKK